MSDSGVSSGAGFLAVAIAISTFSCYGVFVRFYSFLLHADDCI